MSLLPDLAPTLWLAAALSVALAAALQRISGQGFGMVCAPLLALFVPHLLPTLLLFLGALVGYRAMRADLSAVDMRELPPGMAGRALGAVLAAWLAAGLIGTPLIGFAIAAVVYLAIALSLLGLRVAISGPSLFGAGLLAGLMGTLTAIGAPPMALLYQHEDRLRSAAMQNTFFMFGMVVSLAALGWQGLVRAEHLVTALVLAPAVLAGLALAEPLNRALKGFPARPFALGLSGISASVLLLRSMGVI
jgi:uncharacterized membrane protein YfcA